MMGRTTGGDTLLNIELTANEIRVLGCLMEKSVTTPDQYPLTLNALVNACNQKSSREPVMSLDAGEVQRTVRLLEDQRLILKDENFKSRVEKYTQRFCNTAYADLQFNEAEYAVVCVLMLRGPQTPGELRTRCERLHQFDDNQQVAETLQGLIDYAKGAVVARLPRVSGRRDHQYAQLFSGTIESVEESEPEERSSAPAAVRSHSRTQELEARVVALEQKVSELEEMLQLVMDEK